MCAHHQEHCVWYNIQSTLFPLCAVVFVCILFLCWFGSTSTGLLVSHFFQISIDPDIKIRHSQFLMLFPGFFYFTSSGILDSLKHKEQKKIKSKHAKKEQRREQIDRPSDGKCARCTDASHQLQVKHRKAYVHFCTRRKEVEWSWQEGMCMRYVAVNQRCCDCCCCDCCCSLSF